MIWRRNGQTRRAVEIALFEYIHGFYNPRRRHSDLGWKGSVAFERKASYHKNLTGTKPRQIRIDFRLPQDGDDLCLNVCACFHSKSNLPPFREYFTFPVPCFLGITSSASKSIAVDDCT